MSNKCVCGAVGELPIASLGTGLQQAFAAISPNTTTACMGCFKLAVSNAAALQSLFVATPSPQPTAAVPTTAATEPTPEMPSDEDTGHNSVRCSQWRALSARSSGGQKRNPVPILLHLLQTCFLLLFIAFQVRIVHQRPLCIWSLTTKLLTQKCPYAQLLSRYPGAE